MSLPLFDVPHDDEAQQTSLDTGQDEVYDCFAAVISDNVMNQLSSDQQESFEKEVNADGGSLVRQNNKSIVFGSHKAVQRAKDLLKELSNSQREDNIINENKNTKNKKIKVEIEQSDSEGAFVTGEKVKIETTERRTRGKKIDVLSNFGKSKDKAQSKRSRLDTERKPVNLKKGKRKRKSEKISKEDSDKEHVFDETKIIDNSLLEDGEQKNTKLALKSDLNEQNLQLPLEAIVKIEKNEDNYEDGVPEGAEVKNVLHVQVIDRTSHTDSIPGANQEEQTKNENSDSEEATSGPAHKRKVKKDVLDFLKKVKARKKRRRRRKVKREKLEDGEMQLDEEETENDDDTEDKSYKTEPDGEDFDRVCSICGYEASTVHAMRIHKYNYHRAHRHECDICFSTYCMRYMLERHRNYHFNKDGTLKIAAMALHKIKLEELGREETLPPDLVKQIEDAGLAVPDLKRTDNDTDDTKNKDENEAQQCTICSAILSNAYYLKQHMKTVHEINKRNKTIQEYIHQGERYVQRGIKQNSYKCPKCDFVTSRIQNFTTHFNAHHNKPSMFHCDLCDYSNKKHAEIRRHKRNKHGEKIYGCHRCNSMFRTQPQLKSHIKQKHTLSYSRMCSECGKVLSTAHSYKYHVQSHHSDPAIQPGDKIMCQKCGRIFRTIGAFQGHLKKYHANDESLLKEEKDVSEGVLVLNDGNLFECKFCLNYSNTNAREVRQHIVRIHLDKKFQCQQCDKAFPRETFLNKHIAQHHLGLDTVSCQICDKNFKNKNYLAYHQKRVHKKVTAFDCDVCQKSFFRKVEYMSHLEVHKPEDERKWKYECNLCQKRFRFKSNIDYHMLEHTGTRAFSCSICDQSFKTNAIRNNHMLSHNTDRPFHCPHCDKRCKLQKYLDVHMLTHNVGEKFVCKACCRVFPHRKSLEKHICRAVNMRSNRLNITEDHLQKIEIIGGSADMDTSTIYSIPDVPDPTDTIGSNEGQNQHADFVNTVANKVITWPDDVEPPATVSMESTETISNFDEVLQTTHSGYITLPNTVGNGVDTDGNMVIYEAKNPAETEELLQHLVTIQNQCDIKVILNENGVGKVDSVDVVNVKESSAEVSDNEDSYEESNYTVISNNTAAKSCDLPVDDNNKFISGKILERRNTHTLSVNGSVDDIAVFMKSQEGNNGEESNTVYMCGICDAEFDHKSDIETHLLEEHAQNC